MTVLDRELARGWLFPDHAGYFAETVFPQKRHGFEFYWDESEEQGGFVPGTGLRIELRFADEHKHLIFLLKYAEFIK